MAIPSFQQGTLVTVTVTFEVAGVATNPTTVTASWRSPSGTVTALTVTNTATGVYQGTIDTTTLTQGDVGVKFVGTGNCQATVVSYFSVQANPF